jgi:hypothetical protein
MSDLPLPFGKLKPMTFRQLLSLATLVVGSSFVAHAQLGVYGTITGERITGVKCSTTSCPGGGTDNVIGGGGGAYYDFMTVGPARLGIDLRANTLRGNKSASLPIAGQNAVRMDTVLGGVRASFHTPIAAAHPYAQASIGWSRRVNPQSLGVYNFLAYRGFIGLDLTALSFMDVRLPELEIGQNIGRNGQATNGVQAISVGVVFHLPHVR